MKRKILFLLVILMVMSGLVFGSLRIKRAWDLSKGQWGGLERVTTVIMTGDGEGTGAILVSMEPATQQLFIMRLPGNLMVEVSKGYGTYAISSLSNLARQELDWELVRDSIRNLIGSNVDHWLVFSPKLECDDFDAKCVNKILEYKWESRDIETSLTRVTRWRLAQKIEELSIKSVVVDGEDVSWKQEHYAPDGNKEFVYSSDYVDARLAGKFADGRIIDEGLSIGVINATKKDGLAGEVARILVGMGGRVLRLDTFDSTIDNCVVRAREELLESSMTVNKIQKTWNCTKEVSENSGRVDVELWLGKGFFNLNIYKPSS